MRIRYIALSFITFLCSTQFIAFGCERILLFDADIYVSKDGSINVKEEITVQSCGMHIKRGIVREVPTVYEDTWGTQYKVTFNINNVLIDGKPIDYFVQARSNGNALYIGNEKQYLSPGIYTFTIAYTTNRQLGFFERHDELYWNVTGNGWRLPIDKVKARVILPEGIDTAEIKTEAFTGFYGQRGKDVEHFVARNGTVQFTATRNFAPYEGLSIVVGWPKGHIEYPTEMQKLMWFIQDNMHIVILLIELIVLISIFYYIYRRNKNTEGNQPTIPLFHPPKYMTPGMMNYIVHHGYTNNACAAEIVNMAVHGWLNIKYAPRYFSSGAYYLLKNDINHNHINPIYQTLYNQFFAQSSSFKIHNQNADTMHNVIHILKNNYKSLDRYFNFNGTLVISAFFSTILSLYLITLTNQQSRSFFFFSFMLLELLVLGAAHLLKSYTKEGFAIKREIDGFELFLQTTEKDRMKLIGTPPTKTPELYEKYLPYAMALGVEEQWNKQFVPIFEQLKQDGHPYIPLWYVGPGLHGFSTGSFSSQFARGMSRTISSASSRPGSSSGFNGRGSGGSGGGFSGGGGGGGGGGGW